MTPLIGITTSPRTLESSEGTTTADAIYTTYTSAVRRAGGAPVALVPTEHVETVLDRLDGLVLSGGGDVDPARYGSNGHPSVYDVHHERDEFELAVARSVARRGLPTLAICRGMQVMAVAHGGTLLVDIPSSMPDAEPHRRIGDEVRRGVQAVSLVADSRVARVLGCDAVMANSIHHQAVDRLPPGWVVTGRSADGVIEAMEPTDSEWNALAVQWHPEWMRTAESDALFDELVEAARVHRATSSR